MEAGDGKIRRALDGVGKNLGRPSALEAGDGDYYVPCGGGMEKSKLFLEGNVG